MIEYLLAPFSLIVLGFAIGFLFTAPVKKYNGTNVSAFVGWAASSAIALWLVANAEYQYLANFNPFKDFSQVVNGTQFSGLVMGNVGKTTIAALISLYEIGLILGFASLSEKKGKIKPASIEKNTTEIPQKVPVLINSTVNGASIRGIEDGRQNVQATTRNFSLPFNSSDMSLDRDERTIVELFLFGNAKKITPHADVSRTDGYYFEGISSMKIETSKLRQVLDSLARRNILISEMDDKMFVCKECRSPNLQLRECVQNGNR